MSHRTVLSISVALAASAALTAFLVRSAPPAAACGNYGEWTAPVNLGPVVNSSAADQHPAISKDGKSLYLTSTRTGGQGGLDLWVSHRDSEDDAWGAPVNLGAGVNSGGTDMAPTLSGDGHKLYFHSDRTGTLGLFDLYVCERTDVHDDFAWSTPVNLGATINSTYSDAGPTVLAEDDGTTTLWYTILNKPGGLGDWDIYKAILGTDGTFSAPVNVTELNSPSRDTRTSIRHDGKEMFISSERPGGVASGPGASDLWVATRQTRDDAWSTPENLGTVVNSTAFDGAPALSWDGKTLYFFSNRAGGSGGNDLYVTTRNHPGN
jgi:Tol biopolymer transport system component